MKKYLNKIIKNGLIGELDDIVYDDIPKIIKRLNDSFPKILKIIEDGRFRKCNQCGVRKHMSYFAPSNTNLTRKICMECLITKKMKKYLNKIINSECIEVMKELPDNSIDLTITSPPYDNLRDYKGYTFNFNSIAKELFRLTKDGGVVVWVVGDATIKGSETGTSFKQALYFKEIGFNLHDTMIYAKRNYIPLTHNRYEQQFEYMFVFSKGKPQKVNLQKKDNKQVGKIKGGGFIQKPDGIRKRNKDTGVSSSSIKPNIFFYNIGNMCSTKDKEAFKHPAIFPEKLAEDHIKSWSNEGDTVLDPMCGSGTTCKMAMLNNRNFIGIEISKEYCEIAENRLKQKPLL